MASRVPRYMGLDYCFNPLTIHRDGETYIVPCNKCDGCLLHKANVWSMRVGNEIESQPYTLFFTLSYSNKYCPTLKLVKTGVNSYVWTSKHDRNIRFDGTKDCLRKDDFNFTTMNDFQLVRHPENMPGSYIAYSSKRDFQLYLKLVRKDINLKFANTNEDTNLRYFAISEYGPTHLRCHIHALFFVRSHEVAEYLLQHGLYANWQMCDKERFDPYCTYADSGTRNYLTNYVTGFSKLPELLKSTEIKPFRLSSKGFAIGFDSFSEEEVCESVFDGSLTYSKFVQRLESKSLLQYPKAYLTQLFPKCYEYRKRDFSRLLEVYGALYRANSRDRSSIGRGSKTFYPFRNDSKRLRAVLHPQDWYATKKCFDFCSRYLVTPFVYVSLLVDVYYKLDMSNLKRWYLWQQEVYDSDRMSALRSYSNVFELADRFLSSYQPQVNQDHNFLVAFFDGFGIDLTSLSHKELKELLNDNSSKQSYIDEVEGIIQDCQKTAKFNDEFGFSP